MIEWLKGVFDPEKNALTDGVAFATFILAGITFLLREFYYLHQLGFYYAVKIDKRYIDVEAKSTIYYVLLYVGLAVMFLILNYITYSLVSSKKWIPFIALFFGEKFLFWVLLIVLSNVDFLDVIKEMFSSKYYKGYMIIGVALLFAVIAINAYGLVFGISDMTSKKGTKDAADTNNMWKNFIQSGYETKAKTVGFVLGIIIVQGIAFWFMGYTQGGEKQNYKIVVEQASDAIGMDEKYIFNHKNSEVVVYPILYENNEIYLISKLYKDSKGNQIEFETQKVISKKEVETEYVSNIYEFGQETEKSEINNAVKEQVVDGESKEGGNKMLNTIVGVVLGAILTFYLGRYQDNKKEKKRRSHAASLLYYDLLSIANYLEKEGSSVNIRYSNDWQTMVTNCEFLKDEQVQCLYSIYDLVYNYNYHYSLKEKEQEPVVKESICQFKKLSEIFFDTSQEYCDKKVANEEYGKILKALQAHM